MTIGQRIAERRKMLGISQENLGEQMGVSRQAISKWEADGAIPEIDKLIALSKLFGVSVGWLLGTENDEDKEAAAPTREDSVGIGYKCQQVDLLPVDELDIKPYQVILV